MAKRTPEGRKAQEEVDRKVKPKVKLLRFIGRIGTNFIWTEFIMGKDLI